MQTLLDQSAGVSKDFEVLSCSDCIAVQRAGRDCKDSKLGDVLDRSLSSIYARYKLRMNRQISVLYSRTSSLLTTLRPRSQAWSKRTFSPLLRYSRAPPPFQILGCHEFARSSEFDRHKLLLHPSEENNHNLTMAVSLAAYGGPEGLPWSVVASWRKQGVHVNIKT